MGERKRLLCVELDVLGEERKIILHRLVGLSAPIFSILVRLTFHQDKTYRVATISKVVVRGLMNEVSMIESRMYWISVDEPECWMPSLFPYQFDDEMYRLRDRSEQPKN